ncbi:MAG: dihydrodipicolinate synthase family protein, partial [Candidatus Hydrogenedentes bacterium]|nr:dihydrodipicolinate synthase family protein [Candidatus Hydrogenedentota bacterium]
MGRRTFVLSTGAAIAGSLSTMGAGAVASEGTAKMPPFQGMMPIMATPVDAEYKVDIASQRRHVEYCIQSGAVAIGHFAYASEFQKISDADRSQLLDVVVEQVAGRIPFFAGVTGRTAVDTVRYAREAETRGADLIMVSLPFEEQLDPESTFTMFREIGSNVSLPIIIQ